MAETLLDVAFAAMQAAEDSPEARLRFFDRLASTELFVMLAKDAEGEVVEPEICDLGDARFVLGFDLEERLVRFAGRPVPFVALSGRALSGLLAGQGIGLALNLDSGTSEYLLPAEAMSWLANTLAEGPKQQEARPERLTAPKGVPEVLLTALDAKLAQAQGLARCAWLTSVVYDDGAQGHLLGVAGIVPGAEHALAGAINEALVFSGLEAGALDVVFLDDHHPLIPDFERAGLRYDVPDPVAPKVRMETPPGSDPERPPVLK